MVEVILAMLDAAAARHGVDPSLVRAVAYVESRYEPTAQSPRGAKGVMQLMDETALALGVVNVFDPAQNIDGGVRLLKSLLDRQHGNIDRALAAYNWGEGNVSNGGTWPGAVSTYIAKVRARMRQEGQRKASPPFPPARSVCSLVCPSCSVVLDLSATVGKVA